MPLFLSILAVTLSLLQYSIYIRDVIRGVTKPHAFSWFVWAIPTLIVYVAQVIGGGGVGSWATASTAFLCGVIFLLALRYGETNFSRADYIGLFISFVALGLWWGAHDPLWSVTLVTIADIGGFIPTIRKTWAHPAGETLSTYWIGGAKWILSIASLSTFSYTILVYPIAMILGNWGYAIFAHHVLTHSKKHHA